MLKYFVLITAFISQTTFAALPPTSSKGQSGAKSTTFDFVAPYNQYTKTSSTAGLVETGNSNLLSNPGFEATVYNTGWTSSGGTVAAAASTNVYYGKSLTWDSGSAGQEFLSPVMPVPRGFQGQNCEATIHIQVPSGTATHTLNVIDNTAAVLVSQTISTSTTFRKHTMNFPCPISGSAAIAIQLLSVAADEPLIALDDAYLGLARNVGSGMIVTPWVTTWTPTGSWSANTTYTGRWRQVGTDAEFYVHIALSGAPTSAALTINLPSGMVIDTSALPASTSSTGLPESTVNILDGATQDYGGSVVMYNNTTSVAPRYMGVSGSNGLANSITQALPITFGNTDSVTVSFRVPIVGFSAQTTVMPDAQGWYVDANIGGGNPDLGTSNQASYVEITNGSLDLVVNSGSAAAGIACASGTASVVGTLTCSSDESVGATFNVPVSGAYEACFDFTNYTLNSASSNASITFQAVTTSASSSTVVSEGGSRIQMSNYITSNSIDNPLKICGVFQMSAGQNTVRLMREQVITNTPSVNVLIADRNTSLGNRDIHITVKPINGQTNAILANSVSTGNANGIKMEYAKFTCANPSVIARTSTSGWVTPGDNTASAGTCALTFSGFSGPPVCTATVDGASPTVASGTSVDVSSATAGSVTASYSTGGSVAPYTAIGINLICIGPR